MRTVHRHTFALKALLCLFLVSGCARKQVYYEEQAYLTSIHIVDRNGLSETINTPERLDQYTCVDFSTPQPYQKVLRIYNRDTSGNIPACISSYHANGTPKQFLEVVNGRAYGAYHEWHPNGAMKISAQVIEGPGDIVESAQRAWIFDGLCQVWDDKGSLIAELPYDKGNQEGIAKYYYPNGTLQKIAPYQQGRLEGAFEIYCSNGVLLQRQNYCQGMLEGAAHRYWDGEKLAAEEEFAEGLLLYGRYYDQEGTCLAKVDDGNGFRAIFGEETPAELHEYRAGVLEGQITVFDGLGRITKSYQIKNYCKHGEELIYYPQRRLQMPVNSMDVALLEQHELQLQPRRSPKLSINWYEGKIQGLVKTWHENGNLESQKEFSNNKKNGHSTAWYSDGTLMLIEEYEQDTLVRGEYYCKEDKIPISTVEQGEGVCTLFDAQGNFIQKVNYLHGKPQLDL